MRFLDYQVARLSSTFIVKSGAIAGVTFAPYVVGEISSHHRGTVSEVLKLSSSVIE
jgi:hypothetical protein